MTEQPSMKDLAHARKVSAARILLTTILDDEMTKDDWAASIINLKADLSDEDRAKLLAMVLATFPADQAHGLVKLEFEGSGVPLPPLHEDPRADAKLWSTGANSSELMAYACSCFKAMSLGRRQAFLKWVESQE